jgi:hypothetical protein
MSSSEDETRSNSPPNDRETEAGPGKDAAPSSNNEQPSKGAKQRKGDAKRSQPKNREGKKKKI